MLVIITVAINKETSLLYHWANNCSSGHENWFLDRGGDLTLYITGPASLIQNLTTQVEDGHVVKLFHGQNYQKYCMTVSSDSRYKVYMKHK